MKAEFEPAARDELVAATRRYLVEAGSAQASAFETEVTRVVALLIRLPELGAPGVRNTLSITLRRYPFSVHYRELIRIVAVAHHRRRPEYWARRG